MDQTLTSQEPRRASSFVISAMKISLFYTPELTLLSCACSATNMSTPLTPYPVSTSVLRSVIIALPNSSLSAAPPIILFFAKIATGTPSSCLLSATHERCPVEGFSGCPSALELGSIWGFDLSDKKYAMQLPQSHVPQMGSDNFMMFPNWGPLNSVVSDDSWVYKSAAMTLQDLMLPSENGNSGSSMYPSVPSAEILMFVEEAEF
uniref:Uncharacterized protein n=1 Tax=Nelumbo nucifera TaxID=4432 RepID=A0A822ZHU2_NELNU|nr:TPA_asm: hypothetical protein HUJ06_000836 [Nelumbo nucifera]